MDSREGVALLVAIPTGGAGPPDLHDTGLRGFVRRGGDFVLPFHDEMTAEECARIVAAAIRREGGRPVPIARDA